MVFVAELPSGRTAGDFLAIRPGGNECRAGGEFILQ